VSRTGSRLPNFLTQTTFVQMEPIKWTRFAKFLAVLITKFSSFEQSSESWQIPSRILDTGQMDVRVAVPFRVHARLTDVDLALNYTASFAELMVRKDCCLPESEAV
jgi:hypothetical protein